jgi:hypothetical protein
LQNHSNYQRDLLTVSFQEKPTRSPMHTQEVAHLNGREPGRRPAIDLQQRVADNAGRSAGRPRDHLKDDMSAAPPDEVDSGGLEKVWLNQPLVRRQVHQPTVTASPISAAP